jgi:hypothetical protein
VKKPDYCSDAAWDEFWSRVVWAFVAAAGVGLLDGLHLLAHPILALGLACLALAVWATWPCRPWAQPWEKAKP